MRFHLEHGQYCMSGGQDKKLRLWNPFLKDLENNSPIQTYSGHSWEIYDISM
jgi:mitogen-activated protein kinase organizer 1